MTIEKLPRGVMCVGAVRLLPIDVGFDPKLHGAVDLSGIEDADLSRYSSGRDCGGVGCEDADGRPCLVRGTRDEVARELVRAGFVAVIAARTPNGREVRCESKRPDVFVCQPPGDNYWKTFASIWAALAQWS